MRLFVAIELDARIRKALASMRDQLSDFRRDVRWVGDEQMHLTLKFLGEVDDDMIGDIQEACKTVAATATSFELCVDRGGCFPPRGPVRVIWGGCSSTPDALAECATQCDDAFTSLGFEPERRPFAPHMTIGRVKFDKTGRRLRDAIAGLSVTPATQRMTSLALFQSTLTPAGAKYAVVGNYPFGGSD